MSISVVCVRAKYFAQAVATSVERFPAAARLTSAPVVLAKTDGSCEIIIRSILVGEIGRRASAGSASCVVSSNRKGVSLRAVSMCGIMCCRH